MGALTNLMQESLLTVLLYDREFGRRITAMVPTNAYDGIFRQVAVRAAEYWTTYKEPPGEQTLDLFKQLEEGSDKAKRQQLKRLYSSILETKAGVNPQYVLNSTSSFLREQYLRTGIINAAGLIEEGRVSDAEQVIRKSMSGVLDVFHPGLVYSKLNVHEILQNDAVALPTGIKELDKRGLGPTAGELHLLSAPYGRGKSWWLIHLSKQALVHHKRVVYVTLELSEKRVAQRFLQTFSGVARRRREKIVNYLIKEDELGRFSSLEPKELMNVLTLEDEDIEKTLAARLKKVGRRLPLVIRQFPSGHLTVPQLEAYLDSLESSIRFVPDLLVIDYIKEMSIDARNYRHELGQTAVNLRGLAVSRNIPVATVMQVNREWSGKSTITGRGIGEDYSLNATADVHLTYNQSEAEHKIGIARLYVDKGRNEEDRFSVVITQQYATAQFCISSARMMSKYWKVLERFSDGGAPESRRKKL